MIYVGIDDTDTADSPGTNHVARALVARVAARHPCVLGLRHQLLVDPRVPYTSKNSSAALLLRAGTCNADAALVADLREGLRQSFVTGSDPGLCVTRRVPPEITAFGRRCQRGITTQQDARQLAAAFGMHLEGLGGTEEGVIGALAAVGLAASGQDGRIVIIGGWADDLTGAQAIETVQARGVIVREIGSHRPIRSGIVDVGKRLRPNYRDGALVLYVRPAVDRAPARQWEAVRLS